MAPQAATISPGLVEVPHRREVDHRQWGTATYIACVIVIGGVLLAWLTPRQVEHPWLSLDLFAAALLLSALKIRLPLDRACATMTMACTVDFIALLTIGPNAAMIIAAAGTLLQCTVRVRSAQPLYRTAFSVASVVITVQAAALAWTLSGEPQPVSVCRVRPSRSAPLHCRISS